MPKNRHNSRDAKIQPSEVNKCERPLISYASQSPHVKGRGDVKSYPSELHHFTPASEPQNIRPAGLNLKSTTIPKQPVQSVDGASHHQQTALPHRPKVQYCPKHAPSNSLTTNTNPKPPSSSQPTGHSFDLRKNAKGDQSAKVDNVDKTGGQESRDISGLMESRRQAQSSVQSNAKNGGKVKTKNSPAKFNTGKITSVGGKTGKQHATEVTSIPQTNMSIGLLVFCCFNPLLGALAIYLSLTAAKAYRDGNDRRGASRAHWSILMSLFGIMITMVVVSSLVVFFAVNKHSGNRGYRTSVSLPQGF